MIGKHLIPVKSWMAVGLLSVSVFAGTPPAALTVDVDKPGVKVSPMLYGIFFEEINRAGDGGLYAELIRNRSLEDADKPEGWTSGTLDRSAPLNGNNPTSLRIDGRTANEGFKGIAVEKGKDYRLTLYARGEGGLAVELAGAQKTIVGLGKEWKKFEATLTPTRTDTHAQLVIAGRAWLDMVSLVPADAVRGMFRRDLFEMLKAMHPAFVRFPGGCFVEGDRLENAVRWKKTVGDIAERPGHWNLWGYRSTDGFGFYEYLVLCEELGPEPLFVVNVGMSHVEQGKQNGPPAEEFVQDALDAIEYANGPVESKWGALRAKAGHPAPFHLKFMEIGNENGGKLYHERYAAFYDAIKAKYPEMTLIANDCGGVPTNRPVEVVDSHAYTSADDMRKMAARYDNADRKGAKVYFGEYAVTLPAGRGNLAVAVAEAAFMTGLERNSDLVRLASYAPLFEHVGYAKWHPNAIVFDGARCYGIPSYYVQALFAANRADVIVPVDLTEAKSLYAVAGKRGATIILKVVNAGSTAQTMQINLRGAGTIAPEAREIVLTSANAGDENAFETPTRVSPREQKIKGVSASFQHEFPAHSVTILQVNP